MRRFGRYARNWPSAVAVNGPMRMTSESTRLAAGLHDARPVLRDLAAGRHLALDLEPQALELGGRRRRARGGELPQPFVARKLAGRRPGTAS